MNDIEFKGFNKINRHRNVEVTVTEKIDGTNSQIHITEEGDFLVGSRKRYITPDHDNFGFAKWAYEHKDELMKLGVGRHFGEWWGSGIQRKYGLKNDDKRFSLFNTYRWSDEHPACCSVVPVLFKGALEDLDVGDIMTRLKAHGSYAVDGYTDPEGIVIYLSEIDKYLKKTFKNDIGKWDGVMKGKTK